MTSSVPSQWTVCTSSDGIYPSGGCSSDTETAEGQFLAGELDHSIEAGGRGRHKISVNLLKFVDGPAEQTHSARRFF